MFWCSLCCHLLCVIVSSGFQMKCEILRNFVQEKHFSWETYTVHKMNWDQQKVACIFVRLSVFRLLSAERKNFRQCLEIYLFTNLNFRYFILFSYLNCIHFINCSCSRRNQFILCKVMRMRALSLHSKHLLERTCGPAAYAEEYIVLHLEVFRISTTQKYIWFALYELA